MWHDQVLSVAAHAEASTPADELLTGAAGGSIVHADIEKMHSRRVGGVESAHVGEQARGLHHDGHAVELVMAVMKDVPRQAAAPAKCLSKALVRSPAMDCGLRPSIW